MPEILSSPGCLLLSAGFCTSLTSLPDLGGLQAPGEPEEQRGCCWGVFRHWSIPLHTSSASPCSDPTARQTLPALLSPSSPSDEAKSKVIELKTSRDWVQCLVPLHYLSFLRLPRGFWGDADKLQWITWAVPCSRGLANMPVLHKHIYISQGWDDTGLQTSAALSKRVRRSHGDGSGQIMSSDFVWKQNIDLAGPSVAPAVLQL